MKTQRFWGFPWLRLCLLSSFFWISCSVKHSLQLSVARGQTRQKDTVTCIIELEVRLVPGYETNSFPFRDIEPFVQPYDVQVALFDDGDRPKILRLRYRLNAIGQVHEISDKLIATGMVAGIKIIQIEN